MKILIAIFSVCSNLLAQSFTMLNMGQWVDDKFIVGNNNTDGYKIFDFKKGLVYKQHVPYAPLPGGEPYPTDVNRMNFDEIENVFHHPKTSDLRLGTSSIFFSDNIMYAITWSDSSRALQLTSFVDDQWMTQAELDTISQGVILPLRDGYFLVGLRDGHQIEKNKHDPNPFGIYRKDSKGKLQFLKIIDFVSHLGKLDVSYTSVDLAHRTRCFAFTEDHYTYINPDIGMIWTFSKANGKLTRSKTLYPKLLEALRSGKRIVPTVIWAQPTADMHVLISAWSDKLCMDGGELLYRRDEMWRTSTKIDEELLSLDFKLHDLIIAIDPILRWYRYDPATGVLLKEPQAPNGGRDIIKSRDEYLLYRNWYPNNELTEIFYINLDTLTTLHPKKPYDLSKIVVDARKRTLN